MPEPIDVAYVRIRPDFAGFSAEASQGAARGLGTVQARTEKVGVASAHARREVERFDRGVVAANASMLGFGRALTFASAAFLGGAGLGAVIRTGAEEFSNMTKVAATTNALLKSTGAAAGIGAAGIAAQGRALEHLTGVDDELIKQSENVLLSFRRIRNEAGRGNDIFNRATRAALDLSRVFGQDAPSAARQLGRALADPARGVVFLRRAGVVFTQGQIALIKSLVETGQVLRAQRLVLDQVERSVGGTAEAVGRTLPGRLNILKESAKDALGEYVKRLSASREAAELAAGGARGLGQAWGVLRGTVRAVGPPLIAAAQGAIRLTDAVGGVGPILAAIVAYKAVGAAVGLAAKAQAAYARAAVVATGATNAETAAVAANVAAVRAQAASSVVAGGVTATSISRGGVLLPASVGLSAERASVSVARVGVAGRAAAVGLGASRLALAGLGGPLGLAAIGAAGLAVGFLKLRDRAQNAAGGINATRHAFDLLDTAVGRGDAITRAANKARSAIAAARAGQTAQRAELAAALAAQARSQAAPDSLAGRAQTDRVATARRALADTTRALARAEAELDRAAQARQAHQQLEPGVAAATSRRIQQQIDAIRQRARSVANVPLGAGVIVEPVDRARQAEVSLRRFLDLMTQVQSSGTSAQRVAGRALERIAVAAKQIPSRKTVSVVIDLATRGGNINQILNRLRVGIAEASSTAALDSPQRAATTALIDARAAAARRARLGTSQESVALQEQYLAARAVLKVETDKLKPLRAAAQARRDELRTARDSLATARDTLSAAREARQAAIEGLQAARQAQVDAQRALADTIRSAGQAVTQAVRDAKGNLDQLGQAISDALGRFGDTGQATGPLSKEFQRLKAQVLAGGGGPETQAAAQRIASQLDRAGGGDTSTLQRRFADLTDELDRGKISLPQFRRELNRLLGGLNLAAFRRQFGSAAANQLRDEIAALRTQARLIAGGPQRAGGGFQATIVRPLQTVAQGARDVAAAQKTVAGAQKDVAKAQLEIVRANRALAAAGRGLRAAQFKETQKQTVELKAIRKAVEQTARVQAAKNALDRPKPRGAAGQTGDGLTRAGAGAP